MGFDRDKAREVLALWLDRATEAGWTSVLDGLAECVTKDPWNLVQPCATAAVLDAAPVAATPPQGIDRDAVIADAMRMLYEHSPHPDREEAEELVDRMLLHGSYLTAAPDRDIIAAAIQTDFDVRSSAALRVADRILALAAEPELDARCSEGMLITEHTREAATPPQGIDRDADADAAWQAYKEREWHGWDSLQPDLHEAFLAGWVARPVRPVEGVPLVGRDVNVALEALRFEVMWRSEHGWSGPSVEVPRALAERLEKEAQ